MIEFERRGHVGIITINRPDARNAINDVVAQGIEKSLDQIEGDRDLWVGIVTGVPPVFSAGADLKLIQRGKGELLGTERGGFAGLVERQRTKPLIAAVDGPAYAGGTEIVLACDLVVASRRASFAIPEVKRSLLARGGGLHRLPRKIPFNIAMECALSGDPITAQRAADFGFVNALCAPGDALQAAVQLAERINQNAPVAVRAARQTVLDSVGADDDEAWKISAAAAARVMASPDCYEGVEAFIEKREPVWTDL